VFDGRGAMVFGGRVRFANTGRITGAGAIPWSAGIGFAAANVWGLSWFTAANCARLAAASRRN
jgi:hypothetical protein